MTPKFKLTAEAEALVAGVNRGSNAYQSIVDAAMARVVSKFISRVKEAILSQSVPVVPLTVAWAVRKRAKGLDPRILVATMEYVSSFKKRKLGPGSYAVVAKEPIHSWMNDGTKHIPARRVVGPVLTATRSRSSEELARDVMRQIFGR